MNFQYVMLMIRHSFIAGINENKFEIKSRNPGICKAIQKGQFLMRKTGFILTFVRNLQK